MYALFAVIAVLTSASRQAIATVILFVRHEAPLGERSYNEIGPRLCPIANWTVRSGQLLGAKPPVKPNQNSEMARNGGKAKLK